MTQHKSTMGLPTALLVLLVDCLDKEAPINDKPLP